MDSREGEVDQDQEVYCQEEDSRVQLLESLIQPGYSTYALFNLSRCQRTSRLFLQFSSELAVLSLVFSKVFPELTAIPGAIIAVAIIALSKATLGVFKGHFNQWRNTRRALPLPMTKLGVFSGKRRCCRQRAINNDVIVQYHSQKIDVILNVLQMAMALVISFGVRELKDYYQTDDCVQDHMDPNSSSIVQQLGVVGGCIAAYPQEILILFSAYTAFFLQSRGLSFYKNRGYLFSSFQPRVPSWNPGPKDALLQTREPLFPG